MHRFSRFAALALVLVAPLACSSPSNRATEDSNSVSEAVAGTATLSCPLSAVCDASFAYHAYELKEDPASLYLSFSSSIVEGYSLDAFRSDFKYATVTYLFADGFQWQSRETLSSAALTLSGFSGGTLSGHFDTTMSGEIVATSASCQSRLGTDGPPPSDCVRTLPHSIPLHVDFTLALPGPGTTVGNGQ
jgi:hypothetical protein